MTATLFKTVTSDAWVLASDGLENVLITHNSVWPMLVFRGDAAPTADDGYHSLDASKPYQMSGISGQKVYVKCGEPGKTMTVTVDAV